MKALTLEDLIISPQPLEVPTGRQDKGKEVTVKVYIRPLTQVEKDLCTAHSRNISRKWRKKLEDVKSDERKLLVEEEIAEYNRDALAITWVNSKIVEKALEINKASLEDRDKTYVPEPEGDGVTPAEIDHYENEVEEIEEQREETVAQIIERAKDELEAEAKVMPVEQLRKAAVPAIIGLICSNMFTDEYNNQMIARATFTDKMGTHLAFKNAESVGKLPLPVKTFLANSHAGLLIDPEALKNLEGNLAQS